MNHDGYRLALGFTITMQPCSCEVFTKEIPCNGFPHGESNARQVMAACEYKFQWSKSEQNPGQMC
eukprot:1203948-Amphidinium_carterae.1